MIQGRPSLLGSVFRFTSVTPVPREKRLTVIEVPKIVTRRKDSRERTPLGNGRVQTDTRIRLYFSNLTSLGLLKSQISQISSIILEILLRIPISEYCPQNIEKKSLFCKKRNVTSLFLESTFLERSEPSVWFRLKSKMEVRTSKILTVLHC